MWVLVFENKKGGEREEKSHGLATLYAFSVTWCCVYIPIPVLFHLLEYSFCLLNPDRVDYFTSRQLPFDNMAVSSLPQNFSL